MNNALLLSHTPFLSSTLYLLFSLNSNMRDHLNVSRMSVFQLKQEKKIRIYLYQLPRIMTFYILTNWSGISNKLKLFIVWLSLAIIAFTVFYCLWLFTICGERNRTAQRFEIYIYTKMNDFNVSLNHWFSCFASNTYQARVVIRFNKVHLNGILE